MKVRVLQTTGQGTFTEVIWEKPEPKENEIEVKSIMTGVCRSDVDMMNGHFDILPIHMQGHEGLGQVTRAGSAVKNVNVGDYVATRGEPAYADYYNVKPKEYVVVPCAEPKYILEPTACGINVVTQASQEIQKRSGDGKRLLILGSGFLAWVAYNTILLDQLNFEIDVVGNSNKELWQDTLKSHPAGTYDVIIDLSSRTDVFDRQIVNNESLIILGSQKQVTTDFSNLLWKACTMVFPSPRTDNFYLSMLMAKQYIQSGKLSVDHFWSKGYDRNTCWEDAFYDANNRTGNYNRGYIVW
jgi:hypothetical protein